MTDQTGNTKRPSITVETALNNMNELVEILAKLPKDQQEFLCDLLNVDMRDEG